MKSVSIIGLGIAPTDLTAAHLRLIEKADLLIGGRRHLARWPESRAEKVEIAGNLARLPKLIARRMDSQSVVVLATGDPLFFGIGAYLCRHLPPDRVRIVPNVTAVAAAFSRLQRPWQGAAAVSCHGREAEAELIKALTTHDTVAVYTDPRHHPGWLARWLMDRGFHHWRICVAEQLGTPEERLRTFTPAGAHDQVFAEPNLVILDKAPTAAPPPVPAVARPDDAFVHHKGLISKPEVRAISLAKLRLFPHCVLWDLGAGSGAVGIEAAAWITRGRIIAVERRAERLGMIRQNRLRFGVHQLEAVQADLPGGMDPLPDPDRIFVGGGGRRLGPILDAAAGRLCPGGVIVVNTVMLASLQTVRETFARLGLETETVQIQVNRSRAVAHSERFEAENPVWITTATKT